MAGAAPKKGSKPAMTTVARNFEREIEARIKY
jgi:hypothetical protein